MLGVYISACTAHTHTLSLSLTLEEEDSLHFNSLRGNKKQVQEQVEKWITSLAPLRGGGFLALQSLGLAQCAQP
jgi:hypothetical protein